MPSVNHHDSNSRLRRNLLANCLLLCSSWQTAARCHPYLLSLHSQCRRKQLSESPVSTDTLPCGSDAHHVRLSRRGTAFIVEGSEAQLLSYRLETAWYGNLAQSGRDLDLALSLPELVSPVDWPRWLLPPANCQSSRQAAPAMPLRNIRCSPIFRRIRARVCISLYRSLYRRYRYVDRLSTKTSAPARTQ